MPAAGRFRVNNVEALASAARDGAGIAVVPSYAVGHALRAGELLEVLPGWRPLSLSGDKIWAEFVPGRGTLPKVRAMLDFLGELFTGPGWKDLAV